MLSIAGEIFLAISTKGQQFTIKKIQVTPETESFIATEIYHMQSSTHSNIIGTSNYVCTTNLPIKGLVDAYQVANEIFIVMEY